MGSLNPTPSHHQTKRLHHLSKLCAARAFAINDLYPTSSSGDLNVEVKESDGTISSYSVPYSAVPVLQREGTVKYAATAARYRSNSDQQEDTNFVRNAYLGLPKGFTVYGGTQLTEKYSAFALGTG